MGAVVESETCLEYCMKETAGYVDDIALLIGNAVTIGHAFDWSVIE